MSPVRRDVQAMVAALFTVNAGIERAKRERKSASALTLLQVVSADRPVRPSEIAARQHVHQSLITRQVREMEEAGYLQVTANPDDGRSCLVSLTPDGSKELHRLTQMGLDRFASFVDDWKVDEVRALTALLEKLQRSMAAVNASEQPPAIGRRWALKRDAARSKPTDKP
jgi:DNA-binding MarR family transcriptional regulator